MRPVTPSDLDALADQLERTSRVLRTKGREAVRRARDWATPLRSASTNPGRGKGNVSDPTGEYAMSPDQTAEELTLLSVEADQAFDAAVSLESRVVHISTDAVVENQRAGIGYCACSRYCDGTASNRLRAGQCPACSVKHYRKKPEDGCAHRRSTTWSAGSLTCTDCGTVLEAAVGQ